MSVEKTWVNMRMERRSDLERRGDGSADPPRLLKKVERLPPDGCTQGDGDMLLVEQSTGSLGISCSCSRTQGCTVEP